MKRLAIAGLFALSALTSLAQQPIAETIEVRVVNIDVVVRDRAGKPVTGLTKDDFELFESGKKQEITNLYEVRAPAAPAVSKQPVASGTAPAPAPNPAANESPVEYRPHSIVMFIDNYSLDTFRKGMVLKSLQKFIAEKLDPRDQVMLVLCTQQVKVITPFTTDRKAIREGIATIAEQARSGANRQHSIDELKQRVNQYIDAAKEGKMPVRDFYLMSESLVESYVEEVIFSSKNTLAALGQITAAISGVEGKKVLIFAGAHLPERPGVEMYQWLYNAWTPLMGASTPLTTESIMGKTGSMQHYSIEEAARQASINGVMLYLIDAADWRDMKSAETSMSTDTTEQFMDFTNTAMAYQTLARISGGMALTNTENFDVAFQTVATDLNSYYSLGFKPSNGSNTARRNLVVKMKNSQYSARTRETYATKSPQDDMSARVIANLYNSDMHGAWQVELKPGTPEKQGNEYRVPFELSIAPTITLLPQDADLVGGFTVYIVVGSSGRTSKVITSPHPVKIPSDVEDQFRTMPITYKATILMTPGENTLSIGISDQTSNTAGFARAKIVIP